MIINVTSTKEEIGEIIKRLVMNQKTYNPLYLLPEDVQKFVKENIDSLPIFYMNEDGDWVKENNHKIDENLAYCMIENKKKELKAGDRLMVSYTYLISLLEDFQQDGVFSGGDDDLLQLIPENEIRRAIKDGDIEIMEKP